MNRRSFWHKEDRSPLPIFLSIFFFFGGTIETWLHNHYSIMIWELEAQMLLSVAEQRFMDSLLLVWLNKGTF